MRSLDKEEEPVKDLSEMTMDERIRMLRPAARPVVYNLAYFANSNAMVRTLIEMGVRVREWDQERTVASSVLKLDVERDLKPRLLFLHDLGLGADTHAQVITKNPMILNESVENLNVRVQYLRSKKFDDADIREIVIKAPRWLDNRASIRLKLLIF